MPVTRSQRKVLRLSCIKNVIISPLEQQILYGSWTETNVPIQCWTHDEVPDVSDGEASLASLRLTSVPGLML